MAGERCSRISKRPSSVAVRRGCDRTDADLSGDGVECQVGHLDHARLHGFSPALQCPHPGQKLGEVERLDQVVVGPLVETGHPVTRRVACRQHEDGKSGASTTQALDDLEAADLGHPPIEDGDLVLVGVEVAQRQFAVPDGVDRVTALSQATFEHRTQSLIVFGDEHPHGDCLPADDDVDMTPGPRRTRQTLVTRHPGVSPPRRVKGCPGSKSAHTVARTVLAPAAASRSRGLHRLHRQISAWPTRAASMDDADPRTWPVSSHPAAQLSRDQAARRRPPPAADPCAALAGDRGHHRHRRGGGQGASRGQRTSSNTVPAQDPSTTSHDYRRRPPHSRAASTARRPPRSPPRQARRSRRPVVTSGGTSR